MSKDERIAELEEQIEDLKEQVEIWQKLLFEKMETQIVGVTNEKLKKLRHEICEKIRKQFDNEYYWCYGDNYNNIVIAQEDFNIILDQIEGGE